MVQWGPEADAFFMVSMMKVHNIKPNYQAIAANMGDNFTNRALSHRMDSLRDKADQYLSTMALQASAQVSTTQANHCIPATGNKRGPSAAATNPKSNSTTTTTAKTNNGKATAKTSATKDRVMKNNPLKATTNAGVKKRSAPAAKGKMGTKTEVKGKKEDYRMKEEGEDSDATVTDADANMHGEDEGGEAEEMVWG